MAVRGHRRPLLGTSTKMNLTSTETASYLTALRGMTADIEGVDMFVLPPFTSIWVARAMLTGTPIAWGAQDVHEADAGAHTGDISAPMLVDLGCRYVECGHSERRRDHGETDEVIARKVERIVRHGMSPILCVGESMPGDTAAAIEHVTGQVDADLALLDPAAVTSVVIAYEPVWAIGTGALPADPGHVQAVHGAIRVAAGHRVADHAVRIIYGGSVDPSSARGLLECEGVDGLFVGRSALDPANLAAIARMVQGIKGLRDRPHA